MFQLVGLWFFFLQNRVPRAGTPHFLINFFRVCSAVLNDLYIVLYFTFLLMMLKALKNKQYLLFVEKTTGVVPTFFLNCASTLYASLQGFTFLLYFSLDGIFLGGLFLIISWLSHQNKSSSLTYSTILDSISNQWLNLVMNSNTI